MSYMINNNAFEVDPSPRRKRKRSLQCTNAYMNPALDILCTEDNMCNNKMEITPAKRTRRSQSFDSGSSFENQAIDLPLKAYNLLLRKELANVNEKLAPISEVSSPAYQNLSQIQNDSLSMLVEEKSIMSRNDVDVGQVNSTPVFNNTTALKRRASFDLSFIEKLGIEENTNGEALYLDDDLNESNIMEIKTITTVSLKNKKQMGNITPKNTNPFLNCDIDYDAIENNPIEASSSNFPFDLPLQNNEHRQSDNITFNAAYDAACDMSEPEIESITSIDNVVMPRRLFVNDDSSIQYIDDQSIISDKQFGHSTINNDPSNCNVALTNKPVFVFEGMNKQSKILGCDVTNISQHEIFNCDSSLINTKKISIPNVNNNIEATFRDNSKSRFEGYNKQASSKSNNKKTLKIFSKIKDVFKHDKKHSVKNESTFSNPYEVVRPAPVQEKCKKPPPVCFVNPALNLNTTETEFEEIEDDEMKTKYSTAPDFIVPNPFEMTPMRQAREKIMSFDKENLYTSQTSALNNCVDLSDISCQPDNIGKKHVRFDSTLNHEKVITGNSFDSDHDSQSSVSSHGTQSVTQVFHHIDTQIDEFHNELENCFNEKKFITQNL